MNTDITRRALVAAIIGGSVVGGALSPVRCYLRQFAPLSGTAWDGATDRTNSRVESSYGSAELRYDDDGVPNITADSEEALYFAVGYAQARDRLFQLDLQRRLMRGEVSAVVGESTVSSDEFHIRMDFAGAAAATWNHVADTETGDLVRAFSDGVNSYIENEPLPLEFSLLEYEPDPWMPTDTMLMEKQISWNLTGSFLTLRRAKVADALGQAVANELYPARLDHDSPIIRNDRDGNQESTNAVGSPSEPTAEKPATGSEGKSVTESNRKSSVDSVGTPLLDWLGEFERDHGIGSNSWVVSGNHTESGQPIVANDPHLSLMAPPVWYEMNLEVGEMRTRGVTFPGVPFVVIGENHAGAWGFTNTGADVIDFYQYEMDGNRYRYRDEWRDFETKEREIEVAGSENRTITTRKTVHGPMLEREGHRVGVAWTGHTATETTLAIHQYAKSEGMDDVLAATRQFDLPTQNLVYADESGNTLYYVTGRIPRRMVDGEEVRGNRIFDGSAGEGEWDGFTPFGVSSWEGFVPFEEKPHVVNPDVLATANQRVTDDPYLSEGYSSPYRGERIYEMLDEAVESGDIDVATMKAIQDDTLDIRARSLVPELLDAARGTDGPQSAVETLSDWDYRMERDSRAALLFVRWFDAFRRQTFEETFNKVGLDDSYYPRDWVLTHLDGRRWFGNDGRAATMVHALRTAAIMTEKNDEEVYGDYNTTRAITHPFDQSFLNYPELPTDGSAHTVNNYRVESAVGSSWRMICPIGSNSEAIIPGGNSGDYFSDHYRDQLKAWADTEYKPMPLEIRGDVAVTFDGGER
ncbi:penicillin amidase [Haladaptatus litoreus]|uniref:Penicillin amidase n=1 Tax=Haladaptatus litoreus TaxID=553468 RepID=A0A1N6XJ42_9EURY|nr:penicillin acylase family protein [Haladaptatus litoreus]SIR02352.1 penicillin amidase [Haladaptatus litoreus]